MISRTTGHHLDPADLPDILIGKTQFFDHDPAILDPGMDGICHSFGLLIDLLQHEMLKTAFFRGFCIPLHRLELFFQYFLIHIVESNGIFCKLCDLHIGNIADILCIFQNCRYIRSNEISVFRPTNDQRTVFSSRK